MAVFWDLKSPVNPLYQISSHLSICNISGKDLYSAITFITNFTILQILSFLQKIWQKILQILSILHHFTDVIKNQFKESYLEFQFFRTTIGVSLWLIQLMMHSFQVFFFNRPLCCSSTNFGPLMMGIPHSAFNAELILTLGSLGALWQGH